MKDKLISFETAKLAKEKGFDEAMVICQYKDDEWNQGYTELCTQSLLQKWLRDIHSIHIMIHHNDIFQQYQIEYISNVSDNKVRQWAKFNTFEQALEQALFEALKPIK